MKVRTVGDAVSLIDQTPMAAEVTFRERDLVTSEETLHRQTVRGSVLTPPNNMEFINESLAFPTSGAA